MQVYIYQVRGTFRVPWSSKGSSSPTKAGAIIREFSEKGFPVVIQNSRLEGLYDAVDRQVRDRCPSGSDVRIEKVEFLGSQCVDTPRVKVNRQDGQKAFPGEEVSR